jgi:hypothetical protein
LTEQLAIDRLPDQRPDGAADQSAEGAPDDAQR